MANPSMDRDVVAWLRQQLQETHPDLLREMLATMVGELMGAEAQTLCRPSSASARVSGPTLATATGNGNGTRALGLCRWQSPSSARVATSRTGSWNLGERSGRW